MRRKLVWAWSAANCSGVRDERGSHEAMLNEGGAGRSWKEATADMLVNLGRALWTVTNNVSRHRL